MEFGIPTVNSISKRCVCYRQKANEKKETCAGPMQDWQVTNHICMFFSTQSGNMLLQRNEQSGRVLNADKCCMVFCSAILLILWLGAYITSYDIVRFKTFPQLGAESNWELHNADPFKAPSGLIFKGNPRFYITCTRSYELLILWVLECFQTKPFSFLAHPQPLSPRFVFIHLTSIQSLPHWNRY